MTGSPPPSPSADDGDPVVILAGEYVLGLLDAESRARAEALLASDPAFRGAVAAWEEGLSGLNAGFAPVTPPPDMLAQIERRLFGSAPPPPRLTRGRGGFWLSLIGGGLAAGVLVVGALSVAFRPPAPAGPERRATISAEDGSLVFAASWDGARRELRVTRTGGGPAGGGFDHEIWLIGGDGVPLSLGLMEGAAVTRPLATLGAGVILAISLEPEGGSPTGQPTGPVLATGVVEEG